jgi:UTP-glucose-1-phosphate uridylyltransferase
VKIISPKVVISFLRREKRLPTFDEVLATMGIRRGRPRLPSFIQPEPKSFGRTVLIARPFVGDSLFVVYACDTYACT